MCERLPLVPPSPYLASKLHTPIFRLVVRRIHAFLEGITDSYHFFYDNQPETGLPIPISGMRRVTYLGLEVSKHHLVTYPSYLRLTVFISGMRRALFPFPLTSGLRPRSSTSSSSSVLGHRPSSSQTMTPRCQKGVGSACGMSWWNIAHNLALS